MLASACSSLLVFITKVLTGIRCLWLGEKRPFEQCIYYANHSSHADFVLIWSALPHEIRQQTRPVAAQDYWSKTAIRRFMIEKMFKGVLVERQKSSSSTPLTPMQDALAQGASLILFPEGSRNNQDDILQPFKGGLYHLAKAYPNVAIIPVWLDNANRVMPKGHYLPLPLLCTVTFGDKLTIMPDESRQRFLARAQQALLALATAESCYD